MKILTLSVFLLIGCAPVVCAAEPFFKPNDVVALVGGEDMVVMRDYPGVEMLVIQQPGLSGVKFRNLAQEGDTVFEQFRELNFPTWEEQLKKISATVVIARFGKMESLAGEQGVIAFIAAYEKLLDRFASDGRRLIVLSPMVTKQSLDTTTSDAIGGRQAQLKIYTAAVKALAMRRHIPFAGLDPTRREVVLPRVPGSSSSPDESSPLEATVRFVSDFAAAFDFRFSVVIDDSESSTWSLLREKNTLWFHYWRPQNWAFLAGDRTEQPSSRDHRDPTKRWFPAEMEKWLPLIAGKEGEIQETIETSRKP